VKKQVSTFKTEIELQLPAGVSVVFREDSSFNPSTFITLRAESSQNAAAADNLIRQFLTNLLGEL